MCDPEYGVEHSGNTPGGDTLIILNGPLIKELGFNYTQGALRDGFLPNTSVGRFWRLYLRNVAGFLPHQTDKATFGNTWRVVLAENEDVLRNIGWEPNSVEMEFKAGDNTVTIARYTGGGSLSSVSGSTPEEMLPYLADSVQRFNNWQVTFTTSHGNGTLRNNAYVFAHNAFLGYPVGRQIRLPQDWDRLRATASESTAAGGSGPDTTRR